MVTAKGVEDDSGQSEMNMEVAVQILQYNQHENSSKYCYINEKYMKIHSKNWNPGWLLMTMHKYILVANTIHIVNPATVDFLLILLVFSVWPNYLDWTVWWQAAVSPNPTRKINVNNCSYVYIVYATEWCTL